MSNDDARTLAAQLLDAAISGDQQFIASHHLPIGTTAVLGKLRDTDLEVRELTAILERREQRERELESLLINELEKLG